MDRIPATLVAMALPLSACSPGAPPAIASPIDAEDVPALRATFNIGDGGPRVIVLFSSACRACDDGSRQLNDMLATLPGNVTLFAVWEPIDQDDGPPPTRWLENLKDARVRQLWDPTHVFSRELRKAELAHPSSPSQAKLRVDQNPEGILYDTAVVFPPGSRWEETLPAPVFVDGGLARVLPALRKRIASML